MHELPLNRLLFLDYSGRTGDQRASGMDDASCKKASGKQ